MLSLIKMSPRYAASYLIDQVAPLDPATGHVCGPGEVPGVWVGRGLPALGLTPGAPVTRAQVLALFGRGHHPDSDAIAARLRSDGADDAEVEAATRLGSRYLVFREGPAIRALVRRELAAARTEAGVPAGAPTPVGVADLALARAGETAFQQRFGRPSTPRERPAVVQRVRAAKQSAVAGYDLVFGADKGVSALWAVAPPPVADQVEAAHHAAVLATLAWLEDHAVRLQPAPDGTVRTCVGVTAAAFRHRGSRSGDPNLHTHVAVSTKVSTPEGRWYALTAYGLYHGGRAASARYGARLEAELVDRLGVGFRARPGAASAGNRDLVGMDPRLTSTWSTRTGAVTARLEQTVRVRRAARGRTPTDVEVGRLAQWATRVTRPSAAQARQSAPRMTRWRSEAADILGGPAEVDAMLATILGPATTRAGGAVRGRRADPEWVRATAAAVVDELAARVSVWQEFQVWEHAELRARVDGIASGERDDAVRGVVARVLSDAGCVPLGRDDRGRDQRVVRTGGLYSSARVLAAEDRLIAAAGRRDGRVAAGAAVEAVLRSDIDGTDLDRGDADREDGRAVAHWVRELATSPHRVRLSLAPAVGRARALRLLASAWTSGGGDVLGVAPSQPAAVALREELGVRTATVEEFARQLGHRLEPSTLVVLAEAGRPAVTQLARLADLVVERGARLVLLGDRHELACLASGPALRAVVAAHGAVRLGSPIRYDDVREWGACRGLATGDPAAVSWYAGRGRLHAQDGDRECRTLEHAYRAFAADLAAGRDALLVVPDSGTAAWLNLRAQADRPQPPAQHAVPLRGAVSAVAGDPVITRANERRLPTAVRDWVKPGDRWTVQSVHDDGALALTHRTTKRRVVLPPGYVREHVDLGYATPVSEVHGTQAEVVHAVLAGFAPRATISLAMSRGRAENHLHLAAAPSAPDRVAHPPTPADLLTRMLAAGDPDPAPGQRRPTLRVCPADVPPLGVPRGGAPEAGPLTVPIQDRRGRTGPGSIRARAGG